MTKRGNNIPRLLQVALAALMKSSQLGERQMSDHVESMAFTGETPWHGLGAKVSNKLTPEQMVKAAKVNWTVSKRDMYFLNSKGVHVPSKEDFAIVRDTDEFHLTTVGKVYKPMQNLEVIDFFKKFVTAGKMSMETVGSLWHGRYVWALCRINADFAVGGSKSKDEVHTYLLIAIPHIHGKASVIQFTGVRVVCWNTLNLALGRGLKGNGTGFRMPHTQKFDDDMKERAAQALGLAREQAKEFAEASTLLAKKKAKPEQVEEFFCEVLRYDPKKAEKKKSGDAREPNKLPMFREALVKAPGQQLLTAQGTWWGALNAVTYVIDHEVGRERSTALKNAWMGHLAGVKRDALELALKRAS